MAPSESKRTGRLDFVDAARGIAVCLMLLWHSADSWLTFSVREGFLWGQLRFFGGQAAPLFVLLAGTGVALRLGRDDSPKARLGVAARGVEIMLLGYALRMQMWLIDGGAIMHGGTWRAWVPCLAGLVLAVIGLRRIHDDKAVHKVLIGLCLIVLGYSQMYMIVPARVPRALRVDVLQAIGASIVLIALLAHRLRLARAWVGGLVLAFVVALLTPWLGSIMPGPLPVALASYIARWSNEARQVCLFPLAPWFAYAAVGASLGATLGRARDPVRRARLLMLLGLGLALSLHESHAHVQAFLRAAPYGVQLIRVSTRVGFGLIVLGVLSFVPHSKQSPLLVFGRTSLLIYWFHLILAYGVVAKPIKKSLGYPGWALALLVLATLCYVVSRVRLWWGSRR